MEAIFSYVKNNYSWNKYTGIYTDNGIRSTFRDKSGNAADINLMLVSMLEKAGLNAAPVVLSTVGNLMLNYSFPSLTSLNFVIASVQIGNDVYLMDATEKYSRINMLPMRNLNHRGFKINNQGVDEVSLVNYAFSSIKETVAATMNPDGSVSGNYSEIRDSYFAMNDKRRQTSDSKKFKTDYLDDYSFDIDGFRIDENEDKGIFRYFFKFDNAPGGQAVGNKIIFNPLLFTKMESTSFTSEKRNYPLEFGTLMGIEKIVRIKIPEGYKVESLPQGKSYIVDGNVAAYGYKIDEKDGTITVSTLYQVGHSTLPYNFYEPMKEFESNQFNAESQEVVLVKE